MTDDPQRPTEYLSREQADAKVREYEKRNKYGDAFWVEPRGDGYVVCQGLQSEKPK